LFELPLDEYAAEYSTGMKKQLALTALLIQDNDILLLDEPFNGLDLASCLILKQLLFHLKAKNKTILLSSHILSSLTDSCDSIFYLHQGKIQKTYQQADFDKIEREITDATVLQKINLIT
jgi:ABC-2 type transport system ATP-binding protein